jgi:hypothetical protein
MREKQMNEIDISNILRFYSHFKKFDYEVFEVVIRSFIEQIEVINIRSLADIAHSIG